MDKSIDTPLFESQDRRNKFRMTLWGTYLGIVCLILVLETNLTKYLDHERQFVALVFLLYSTHYFSCRAKGENFLFTAWGVKPVTKEGLRISDVSAVIMYLLSLCAVIFDLFK